MKPFSYYCDYKELNEERVEEFWNDLARQLKITDHPKLYLWRELTNRYAARASQNLFCEWEFTTEAQVLYTCGADLALLL